MEEMTKKNRDEKLDNALENFERFLNFKLFLIGLAEGCAVHGLNNIDSFVAYARTREEHGISQNRKLARFFLQNLEKFRKIYAP